MVKYCPICSDKMIYDPATDHWYCVECELAIAANLQLDKSPRVCYTRSRPRLRGTPVPRKTLVLRD